MFLKQHNSTALIKVLIKSCFYMVIRLLLMHIP